MIATMSWLEMLVLKDLLEEFKEIEDEEDIDEAI